MKVQSPPRDRVLNTSPSPLVSRLRGRTGRILDVIIFVESIFRPPRTSASVLSQISYHSDISISCDITLMWVPNIIGCTREKPGLMFAQQVNGSWHGFPDGIALEGSGEAGLRLMVGPSC